MSNNTTALSFDQIANAIMHGGHERTIIVEGPFGIGKTAIYHALRRKALADPNHPLHNHIWTGVLDCTQLSDGSIWMPDVDKELGTSRELPNERFGVNRTNQKGVPNSRPVVIMADEIAKAPQYVKNMLAPIFYERRVGNYELPDGSLVWGATNMAIEGLGDLIQPHLRNRVTTLQMRAPTAEEWVNNFAVPHKLHPTLIAFVHAFPKVLDTFLDYREGGKYGKRDLAKDNPFIYNPALMGDACSTPRSLHAVSDWMHNCEGKVDDDTLMSLIAGTAGVALSKEILAFIRYGRDIPTFQEVVKDPKKAPVPKAPTSQIVQVFQLVTCIETSEQADAVAKYVRRTEFKDEMRSLFITVAARTANSGTFLNAKEWVKLLAEEVKFFGN